MERDGKRIAYYKDVPWFRRNDFFWLLSATLPAAALLVMLTGNVYLKQGGRPWPIELWHRIALAVLFSLVVLAMIRFLPWLGLLGPVANAPEMLEVWKEALMQRELGRNNYARGLEALALAVGFLILVPVAALMRVSLGVFLFVVGAGLSIYSVLAMAGLS